ncbi:MAG TPA: RES family NAD+ phosphorylase [Chitinophagaceae bacterium]|nr:RES family NAD+ phosphorylase [Chitinophagaceae bacterium]
MEVYRISRSKWAEDLSGEGARLFGGRWNRKGTPCLYTSSTRSLAILEFSVNVSLDEIPRALSIVTLKLPDQFLEVKPQDLPGNWKDVPAPGSTREFGTRLLEEAKHLIIRLPSSVIPQEFNFIINPVHKDHKLCKVIAVDDFVYDVRIKLDSKIVR